MKPGQYRTAEAQGAAWHLRHPHAYLRPPLSKGADRAASMRRMHPFPDYLKVRERLGIERTVVVQPSTYGTDNRCTIEADESA